MKPIDNPEPQHVFNSPFYLSVHAILFKSDIIMVLDKIDKEYVKMNQIKKFISI